MEKTRTIKIGLLGKIVIAIAVGIITGLFFPEWLVRIFLTLNGIFGEFLGFAIPLIILGLVSTAIADIGTSAGKMLLITVAIAYGSTILAGSLSYLTGAAVFPSLIDIGAGAATLDSAVELDPYFSVDIPAVMNVMTALVLAFVLGLGMSTQKGKPLNNVAHDFEQIVVKTIKTAIIPFLPIYIRHLPQHDICGTGILHPYCIHQDHRNNLPYTYRNTHSSVLDCRRFCRKEPFQASVEHDAGIFHSIGNSVFCRYHPGNS